MVTGTLTLPATGAVPSVTVTSTGGRERTALTREAPGAGGRSATRCCTLTIHSAPHTPPAEPPPQASFFSSLPTPPGGVSAIAANGAVTLPAAGAALVNAGGDLPPVEVTVTDGTTPVAGSVYGPVTNCVNEWHGVSVARGCLRCA